MNYGCTKQTREGHLVIWPASAQSGPNLRNHLRFQTECRGNKTEFLPNSHPHFCKTKTSRYPNSSFHKKELTLISVIGGEFSNSISENGVSTVRREHIPSDTADEQCHNHRREGLERMLKRDHARSLASRCAVQARP